MNSEWIKTEWGCYRNESRKAEVIRIVYEEDNDYGDKSGDVAYIIKWDDGGVSDPYTKLRNAKGAVMAAPG